MQYERLMGIDFGDKRIGIAFSDPMRIIVSPYEVYQSKTFEEDIEYLSNLAHNQKVGEIIIGLPLNMDGTEGYRAKITKNFASKLAKMSGVKVVFQDERLSSVEAENFLIDANVKWEDRKNLIDKISACIILESYMKNK